MNTYRHASVETFQTEVARIESLYYTAKKNLDFMDSSQAPADMLNRAKGAVRAYEAMLGALTLVNL